MKKNTGAPAPIAMKRQTGARTGVYATKMSAISVMLPTRATALSTITIWTSGQATGNITGIPAKTPTAQHRLTKRPIRSLAPVRTAAAAQNADITVFFIENLLLHKIIAGSWFDN